MNSSLYLGKVMHRRRTPGYRFIYRVYALYLDIDELQSLHSKFRVFSHNSFNILSIYDEDLGSGRREDLRTWAEAALRKHGVDIAGGKIYVLTYPRVLGYGFSPLSVWYCHHQDGRLLAMLAEVHNTFGERHHYLLPVKGESPWQHQYLADKAFYVSPFLPLRGEYRFRFLEPGESVAVFVHESIDGVPAFDAAMTGKKVRLSNLALLAAFCQVPLLGIKITALTLWQALKIRLRGVRFSDKPEPPAEGVTAGWMEHKS